MRPFFFILLFSLTFLTHSQVEKKKVVFIIVDGISTDMYHKANPSFLNAMSKKGAFSTAYVGGKKGGYSETPTISAVGYNSLLTGVWVNKHNVYGNSIKNPNYNYPTIFKLFKDTYPDKKIAIFSTWLDNRTKLVGENLPETGNIKMDYAFDGLELDLEKYPHDKEKKYLKRIDGEVARKAANYIYKNGPDLSWVYLEHSDDMGHMYGEGQQFYDVVNYEDALIGMIWDAVKLREKETGEDWLIIVTTDHGRRPIDGKHHGGQSDRERGTWVVLNKPITNKYFLNNNVAIVDLMPTMIDYLKIKVPKETKYEIDGVSLIGKVDAFNLEGICIKNNLYLKWMTKYKNGKSKKAQSFGFTNTSKNKTEDLSNLDAKVYVSYTNNKKTGGKDYYNLAGKVNIQNGEALFKIKPKKNAQFLKVVLETKNHSINTWVRINKQ